jgi:DNA-binding protein H-NS
VVKQPNFQAMSAGELWELHEQVNRLLAEKLTSEKRKLERRLSMLHGDSVHAPSAERPRHPYPKVHPKYQNPDDPSQTWAGRGPKPRWFNDMLDAGINIDELRIRKTA